MNFDIWLLVSSAVSHCWW